MVILRSLKLGLNLNDLDNITIGAICELIETYNYDANSDEEIIEATPEIIEKF